MANFILPNGLKVEAPDDWTADQVMAEYESGRLSAAESDKPWQERLRSYLTETGPPRRIGSYWEEATAPFKEIPGALSQGFKETANPIPVNQILAVLQATGAPFASFGNVAEKIAEQVAGKSTPLTRLSGLAAETFFPVGTITKGIGLAARAASRIGMAGDVAKILEEAGVPAEQITEAIGELKSVAPAATEATTPVRPFSVSELLARAKQTQNPVLAETQPERLLQQAKNIDVGAHTPSIFDTAEDLVRRRNYTPVEARPLFQPEAVRPAQYTQRELEAMQKGEQALSRAEKVQQYRERIGLAEPTVTKLETEAAQLAEPAVAESRPLAQQLVEGTTKFAKTGPVAKYVTMGYDRFLSPILSRLESLGPEGAEMSRLEQRKHQVATFLFRDIFEPLYDSLHGLSDQEAANFVAVVQGETLPETKKIIDLVDHWNKVFGEEGLVVKAFRQRGIQINPRSDFFPREFSAKVRNAILNDKVARGKLVEQVAQANGISRLEARRAIESTIGRKPVLGRNRQVSAEYARTVDLPDYIQNPAQVTAMRGWSVANRLAELSIYGPKDENIMAAVRAASVRNPKLGDQLHKLFELTIRRSPIDAGLAELSRKAMTWQAITKLPLAFIPNLGQPVLGALRTDLSTAAKGFLKFLVTPGRLEAAREVGMAVDMIVRRNMIELSGGPMEKTSQFVLGPFNIAEKAVRAVAVQQAESWAFKLQKLVERGDTSPWLRRELNNLLFSPTEIHNILATKTLTPEDIRQITYAVAEQVVFVPRAARRSAAMLEDPRLAVLLQFKNFISNSTRLLKNAVIEDARRGNIRPLYHILSAMLPSVLVGEIIGDVRAFWRGSQRPPIGTASQIGYRALDNIMAIGSLGVGLDLLNAAENDPAGLVLWGAGPTFGDLTRLGFRAGNALSAVARRDWPELGRQAYETGRFATRQIPIVGSYIANQYAPSSINPKTFPDETYWDRIGFTQRARERARFLDAQRRLRSAQGLRRVLSNAGVE